MFCPKCGTTNPDQAKFCRACGTNLETVTLALAGELVRPDDASRKRDRKRNKEPRTHEDWLRRWGKGQRDAVLGAILLGVALLTGSFWGKNSVEVWVILFGWMCVVGAIMLAFGSSIMVESKSMLRRLERITGERAPASTTPLLSDARAVPMPLRASATAEQGLPPSVTEHTTQSLGEHRAFHPDIVLPEKAKK